MDEELVQLATQAVVVAARDRGVNPSALASELAQGEIGLLISYLEEAAPHVGDLELRVRIDTLLHRLVGWSDDG